MTIPMIVLAVGSVFAGGLFSVNEAFVKWLEPVTSFAHGHSPVSADHRHRLDRSSCCSSASASPG